MKALKLAQLLILVLFCCFACSSPLSEQATEKAANHASNANTNTAAPPAEARLAVRAGDEEAAVEIYSR